MILLTSRREPRISICRIDTLVRLSSRFSTCLRPTHTVTSTCGALLLALLGTQLASGQLGPGLSSNFEDGPNQGWTPNTFKVNGLNVAGGPAGSTRFLEVSPGPPHLSVFNGEHFSGPTLAIGSIEPALTAISVDLMRPNGQTDVEMRLVLVDPSTGDCWTSTSSQVVPGDGTWNNYTFSSLEADLTHVGGAATYADLTGSLSRMMFRFDPGAPSSTGSGGTGTFGLDNVTVIPEPGTWVLIGTGLFCAAFFRRRSSRRRSSR